LRDDEQPFFGLRSSYLPSLLTQEASKAGEEEEGRGKKRSMADEKKGKHSIQA